MDETAFRPIFVIVRIGVALVVVGLVLKLAGSWARKQYVAKHGEGSLPPAPPSIWQSLPKRDRWILGILFGGSLLLGIVLNVLHS